MHFLDKAAVKYIVDKLGMTINIVISEEDLMSQSSKKEMNKT